MISDRSLSSSFIERNWEGYCARSDLGRSLNYCACERDTSNLPDHALQRHLAKAREEYGMRNGEVGREPAKDDKGVKDARVIPFSCGSRG